MSEDHDRLERQYYAMKARRDAAKNYAIALLQEQHKAMADVMALRRLSKSQEQREQAENAIAVWRKVETFLAQEREAGE